MLCKVSRFLILLFCHPFILPAAPFFPTLSTSFLSLWNSIWFCSCQVYPFLPVCSIPPQSLHTHDGAALWDLADGDLFCPRDQWWESGYLWAGITAVLFIWIAVYLFFPVLMYNGFEVLNFPLANIIAVRNLK